ncbi:AGE family epimerase/isomerase [Fodinibius sediminis]|uniref:N-acylglucosamine 2-epimerase n=1 Tax=Fodinibius sediminis TaxID=1214077 RepID=A0A521CTC6_9BACT|nr:AGE family epimerase/isomerase [Fodinibius sediminis]SMO62729.1 N-acylglucosamine 2-epimerase [Fodinibius sediminis]
MEKGLADFYLKQVEDVLLPFWNRALDQKHGGIFTCFNNRGDALVSTDKYTWSQGRFLWLWSEIIRLIDQNILKGEREEYLRHLNRSASFLEEHVFLPNGNCAFLLTKEGHKKESVAGAGYDSSIYADCFVALGLAKVAGLTHDEKRFERVLDLYHRIRRRIEKGSISTEPYPIPKDYRAHSIPMIMLNVAQEMAEVAVRMIHPARQQLVAHSVEYMEDIMEHFYMPDHRVVEMLPIQRSTNEDKSLLYRHLNPGHTIESMWFVIHTAREQGYKNYVEQAVKAIRHAVTLGWDEQYGGLLRFVDREGGKPRGAAGETAYEELILGSWNMKLWWPHSEALYALLLAYDLTRDEKMLKLYEKVEQYVFNTFPNPDKNIGEWIQIRDRKGKPIDKIAALPVKDPFHILRNMILIIDLLAEKEE